LEQLTLFEKFDRIENLHDDNTIFLEALNWRAKFKLTGEEGFKRRVDIYCSCRDQLKQLEVDLLGKGWNVRKKNFPFPAMSFSKADMLVVFYGIYG